MKSCENKGQGVASSNPYLKERVLKVTNKMDMHIAMLHVSGTYRICLAVNCLWIV